MHRDNPAPLLEQTFERIRVERMAGMSMLNPALAVAAVDFARQGNEWRGVLVTPWGINLLLLPAVEEWLVPAPHERVFRTYPAGNFAFLGNREEGLGDYLACPLIHDMQQFEDQETAVNTARACLIALDLAPATAPVAEAAPESPARRKMFGLRG
jgi:[NiFe] hydrogenase assembly HybE family chaperone